MRLSMCPSILLWQALWAVASCAVLTRSQGSKDHLIPCENIVMHYNALHAAHPQLAYLDEFKHSGHLEFTVGLHDTHISRIVQIVDGEELCVCVCVCVFSVSSIALLIPLPDSGMQASSMKSE